MTQPTKHKCQQNQSDFESCDTDESIDIGEQVQNAIRELPTLQQKVQAIAINHYLVQKRQNDEKLQAEKTKLQFKTRTTYNVQIQQIYAIIEGTAAFTKEDYQFIAQQKQLFKEGELEIVEKIIKEEHKLGNQDKEIEHYWLKCMTNSDIIGEQIHDNDKQVLKYLERIESWRNQDNSKLIISFTFKQNKWFKNTKIQKNFEINPSKSQLIKSYGDDIEWKQGMNYTFRVVRQKGKKKGKKTQKQQQIREPSFFHYFMPLSSIPEQNAMQLDDEQWEDLMEDLQSQHQLAEHIHEDLIPKSLQYFLGKFEEAHSNCHCHGHEDGNEHEAKTYPAKQNEDDDQLDEEI